MSCDKIGIKETLYLFFLEEAQRMRKTSFCKKITAFSLGLMLIINSGNTTWASKLDNAKEDLENAENNIEDAKENLDDAQDKKEEAENQYEDMQAQINDIANAQDALEEEMALYDNDLMLLLTDIEILSGEITQKQADIDQANRDLEDAIAKEEKQYEDMKDRIQFMYENGNNSFFDVLVEAESFTDLLNRVEYVNKVHDYDREQLAEYQETVALVEDLTERYNSELVEMEELEINLQEQAGYLEVLIAEMSVEIEAFGMQLVSAQALASEYAETIREQNEIIALEEQRLREEEAKKAAAQNTIREEEEALKKTETEGENAAEGGESSENQGDNSGGEDNSGGGDSSGGSSGGGANPGYTTNVSGADVVNYACQFVGNPYVFGGTSLTEGCDCSYFVKACFGNFGITLPRTSYSMRRSGYEVSYENARAGDIICYAGHVALYMGNGKIVHASSPTNGICYGTATYRTIITVRRVL